MTGAKPSSREDGAAAIKPESPTDFEDVKKLLKPNPLWKYMGFGENFRPRLPSRNWMIFLTMTASFTGAVIYDKREKKRAQRKWCKMVEHVAKEPLDARAMPRKLKIYLEAPPKDGLRVIQEHFKDYIKPILVSSGLDWEIIQGRREGDIRAEVAERIRGLRLAPRQRSDEDDIAQLQRRNGVRHFEGPEGDIIVGRHTWKEYVRGLHEGWLGPLTEKPPPVSDSIRGDREAGADPNDLSAEVQGITPAQNETPPKSSPESSEVLTPRAPFISTDHYLSVPIPAELPSELDPSALIIFPHILGFLNTPKRLYRFLNRRFTADAIGRETAAAILSAYRPYHSTSKAGRPYTPPNNEGDFASPSPASTQLSRAPDELQEALQEEEGEWHKSTWVRVDGEPERTWIDPVVLHPEIATRLRRFELRPEDQARAMIIVVPEEEIEGRIKGSLRSGWRACKTYFKSTVER